MPSIVAGHIDRKHFRNNIKDKTLIIAISENVIKFIEFTVILVKTFFCRSYRHYKMFSLLFPKLFLETFYRRIQ